MGRRGGDVDYLGPTYLAWLLKSGRDITNIEALPEEWEVWAFHTGLPSLEDLYWDDGSL